jgi:hypothetical protein
MVRFFALAPLLVVLELTSQSHAQSYFQAPPPNEANEMSLAQFNAMLMTETAEEFGVRLSPESSEALWRKSIELSWSFAEAKEKTDQSNMRARSQSPTGTKLSSFVICDKTNGKQGQQAKEDLVSALQREIMIVSLVALYARNGLRIR